MAAADDDYGYDEDSGEWLTGDAQELDCKYPGIKGLVLRAEFVRKR